MSLRLKMKLQKVATICSSHVGDPEQQLYELFPVYGPENKPWSRYTPSGILQFTVTNPEAQKLELGKEYFVDLIDADAVPATETPQEATPP